jgi:hypothetical protein
MSKLVVYHIRMPFARKLTTWCASPSTSRFQEPNPGIYFEYQKHAARVPEGARLQH